MFLIKILTISLNKLIYQSLCILGFM